MQEHPSTASPAPADPLTALAAEYTEWQQHPAALGIAAEQTPANGRHIRYLAARTVNELAAKLATVEMSQP